MKEGGPSADWLDDDFVQFAPHIGVNRSKSFPERILSVFLAESRESAHDLPERIAPPPFIAGVRVRP
jgi:hypothetical protein